MGTSQYRWCYETNWSNPQSVYLRFVFSSDSIQTNKEGWVVDDIQVFSDICEGINELQKNNSILLYPNPAIQQFIIETNTSEKQTAQVFDLNGKLVLSETINGKTIIDASTLNEGVYTLTIRTSGGVANKKLVIV